MNPLDLWYCILFLVKPTSPKSYHPSTEKKVEKRQHHPKSSQNHRARIPDTLFHFFGISKPLLGFISTTIIHLPVSAPASTGCGGFWGRGDCPVAPLEALHLDTAFALNGNVCQTQLLEVSACFSRIKVSTVQRCSKSTKDTV